MTDLCYKVINRSKFEYPTVFKYIKSIHADSLRRADGGRETLEEAEGRRKERGREQKDLEKKSLKRKEFQWPVRKKSIKQR